jgi:uncharacterized protein (TIGR04255 family)
MSSDSGASEQLHYEHAPILEASVTIQIDPLPDDRQERLRDVGTNLGDKYKVRKTSEKGDDADDEPEIKKIAYLTEDEKHVVRAMPDGVTFSWQAPYDSWERFLPEVRRTWDCYSNAVGPVTVNELIVSYVNSIKIPIGVPLHDLFNTYPMLPNKDELLNELLMNYSIGLTDPKGRLAVTMVWLGSRNPELPHMLLSNRFNFAVSGEAEIWELMPRIRSIKNATFESQITPRLKETFK